MLLKGSVFSFVVMGEFLVVKWHGESLDMKCIGHVVYSPSVYDYISCLKGSEVCWDYLLIFKNYVSVIVELESLDSNIQLGTLNNAFI